MTLPDTDTRLDEVLLRVQSQRFEGVIETIDDIIAHDPTHARAHLLSALTLFELDRLVEAMRAIATAVRLAPHYVSDADLAHGVARVVSRSLRRKLELIELDPGSAFEVGRIRAQEGDYEGALAAYEVGLCRAPTPMLHTAAGIALRILGRHQEAIEQHERALHLDPGSSLAHNNLAAVFADLSNVRATRYHAEQALKMDARAASAQVSLAVVLLVDGQVRAALDALTKAERADRDFLPEIAAHRVAAHLLRRDLDAAERDLAAATGHARAARVPQLELATAAVHRAWGRHPEARQAVSRLWGLVV